MHIIGSLSTSHQTLVYFLITMIYDTFVVLEIVSCYLHMTIHYRMPGQLYILLSLGATQKQSSCYLITRQTLAH